MSSLSTDPRQLPVIPALPSGTTNAPWTGAPHWPDDVSAAVAKRLLQLKSQLLDIVVKDLNTDKNHGEQDKAPKAEDANSVKKGWLNVPSLLNLETEYLQSLEASNLSAGWMLRTFESWTKAELEELLSVSQWQEFREAGLSSFLAQIEYPWETELARRLNPPSATQSDSNGANGQTVSTESNGQSRNDSTARSTLDGLQDWSPELSTAVSKRLFQLKASLIGLVFKKLDEESQEDTQDGELKPRQEDWLELHSFLNLDKAYMDSMQVSNPNAFWLLCTFENWIRAEIVELLSDAQRQEFRNLEMSSLLARIDFPLKSELQRRLNEFPELEDHIAEQLIASVGRSEQSAASTPGGVAGMLDWPEELSSSVSKRLSLLKSQLLDIVVMFLRFKDAPNQPDTAQEESEGDDGQLERLLNLDEGYLNYLESSDPSAGFMLRMFGSWTQTLIDEMLCEDQRQQFRNVGMATLLPQVHYPWETELTLRLNNLHVPQMDFNALANEDPEQAMQAARDRAIDGFSGGREWPEEVNTTVAKRLFLLKSHLLEIVFELLSINKKDGVEATDGDTSAEELKNEEQDKLQLLLNLDERYLRSFEASDPSSSWLLRSFGAWTEGLIEELLTEPQRQEFQEVGISSLLSRIEFPWDTELVNRLNRSNADGGQRDYSELFCPRPFQYVEIGPQGRTHLCCAVMLPTVVGEEKSGTFLDVWNSETAQKIRQSILDGTYTHCVEHLCPDLRNRSLPKRDEVEDPYLKDIIANNRTVLPRGPERITMNYDNSCNLACPMCRTERITLKGEDKRKAESVQEWATREHLRDAHEMVISTAGDAFGSGIYHSFLRTFDTSPYPDLRLRLLTNGLHLTPKNWDRICHDSVDTIHVSIDAATPETYRVNRGGNFERLKENLHFIGSLRSSGQIKSFIFNYTVQENNFEEMPLFVALASAVKADQVIFIQLANGTFSQEVYKQRAVHQPSHPRHGELLEVLKNPLLRMPMVQLQLFEALG